ncbi:hypothetical protein B0H11DRAFT_1966735, partial [Mycena galericulata]
MTRHPGGVAAHLLSRRHLPRRTLRVSAHRVPHAVPFADLNRSHAPRTAIIHPRRIPSPDRSSESNPPHVPPITCVVPPRISPPLPCSPIPNIPDSTSQRSSKPDPPPPNFIQRLFDFLVLSRSYQRQVATLIETIDRLDTGQDPFHLWERL